MPAASFAFRPLAVTDLPALHRWFNAPHARRWFGDGRTLSEVEKEYVPTIEGRVPIRAFVVEHEGRAIGMAEWVRFGDFPDMQRAYGVRDPESANCDILVGEPDAAHRGLGAPLVRAFLEQIVFADPRVTSCVIDPVPDNAIAIRAYEKVGFRFLHVAPDDDEGNAVYLMELGRAELGAPSPPSAFHLRPARPAELGLAGEIDDDACAMLASVDRALSLPADHPFVVAELARWDESFRAGRAFFACAASGEPLGFCAMGFVDGRPHLHQVSVRRAAMGRGVGRMMVDRALRWSTRAGELWLTTYDDVPWNAPWYARLGFADVPTAEQGAELRALLGEERAALPAPAHRIAMRYRHPRW